jgi:hypothetical protein
VLDGPSLFIPVKIFFIVFYASRLFHRRFPRR